MHSRQITVATLVFAVLFGALRADEPKDAARVSGTETYVMTPQFQLSSTDNTGDAKTRLAFPGNRQDAARMGPSRAPAIAGEPTRTISREARRPRLAYR